MKRLILETCNHEEKDVLLSGGAEADSNCVNSMLLGWQPSHRYRRFSLNTYNGAVVDLFRCCNVFSFVMFLFGMVCFAAVMCFFHFSFFNSVIKIYIFWFVFVGH